MKKSICFIANYYKTEVFLKIAAQLQQLENINVCWIVPNGKQYKELQKIYPKDNVLYIGKKEILQSNAPHFHSDLKINELVYGDRVLRYESALWTFTYLDKLKNGYAQFITANAIQYIFGEVTWAHELLAHRLVTNNKTLNCTYLNPHTIRIPNGRFAFFEDEFQSKIKECSPSEKKEHPLITLEKPSYLALNDALLKKKGSLKSGLGLLKNFIFRTNQDSNDPTLYSNWRLHFKIRSSEVINKKKFALFVSEKNTSELPKDKKQVLFTLHKQPEASIDVIGRYYENQLQLITNICRLLPQDYILLVKEHSNAIGDRNTAFYKKVTALKNTYLVHHKTNSHQLLQQCEAVFTVSGTIGYEAALSNIKAFTFGPAFFNGFNHCVEVSWKDFKYNTLEELIQKKGDTKSIQTFSNWLLNNSFEGIFSDAFADPRCVTPKNIEKLVAAFLTVIK